MRTAIEVLLLSRIAGHGLPPSEKRRLTAAVLAIAMVLVLLGRPAAADTYTWDVSGGTSAPQDGSGIWSTSTSYANWWTSSTDVAWPTGGTDTAAFGGISGTAGTVTVSGAGVGVGAMIFNTPDWSTYTIGGGSIALGGVAPTITVNTNASIGSILTGSGTAGLVVNGGGWLELTAANTYTGPTTVSGSTVLRLSNSAALPAGSNLTLDGGQVELAAGDFTASLGTAAGQVQFSANGGGFSAAGANRIVNLSNSATLTWAGTSGFLGNGAPLMLRAFSANSTIDFQNPIVLSGGTQAVQVTAGSATPGVDARLSGVLSGSGGLTITGGGNLELTASNTYTGPTIVSNSILRLSNSAALPTGSNLTLDGGQLELAAGDFTSSLGTAPGQVQFSANGGGFAAVGGNRVVNLSNSATLTWGSGSFLLNNAPLMLGTWSADSTVDFQNPLNLLDLGNGPQNVQVALGSGTVAVNARLSGTISGSGGLTITGGGNLELTASNTYTGPTIVSSSILRLSNSAALPTGSNLTLDGGQLELAAGDFTSSLGTAPGQVQFSANGGGFAAVGGNRVVNLSNSATLTWGSGSFLLNNAPLMLGTWSADSTVDFQNPIVLSGGTQTVQVTAGSGTPGVDARLSGILSGSGGLTITGGGNLELTASNTYTGPTTVSSSILRLSNSAALPTGSNLTIDSGVLELNAGDFTRNLGTGPGQVQFTANGGGFAAVGSNRVVNLSNSATLTWGSGSFLPNNAPLMLGSTASDATVDFQNSINLGSESQVVLVTAGTAPVSAELSGVLSGNGGLRIAGGGTLLLSGTDNTYSGGTFVESGTLIVASNGALPSGSNLTVGAGGTFIFDPAEVAGPAVASAAGASRGEGVTVVPEPGTLGLLGTAMALAIGALILKRKLASCQLHPQESVGVFGPRINSV